MKEYIKHLIVTAAILISIVPSLLAQSGTYYTVRDLEVWTAAKVEYKLNKKLDFGFEEQLRLKDNASTIDQYFSEITVGYNLKKKISLGLGLRYIKENDNVGKIQGYENHLRWNGDLSYKHKLERFSLKYRLRYQSKNELNVSEAQGDTLKNTIRLKVGSTYNIKGWKLDPKVSLHRCQQSVKASSTASNIFQHLGNLPTQHKAGRRCTRLLWQAALVFLGC